MPSARGTDREGAVRQNQSAWGGLAGGVIRRGRTARTSREFACVANRVGFCALANPPYGTIGGVRGGAMGIAALHPSYGTGVRYARR